MTKNTSNTSTQDMLTLPFTKMHGLGNDFVMIHPNDIPDGVDLQKLTKTLCHRQFGIGADGLITVGNPSDTSQFDTKFVYLNSDGSWAEMCGNGIRCFAIYAKEQGFITNNEFTAETLAGPISPKINADGTVTVNMGAPILTPAEIPYQDSGNNTIIENEIVEVLDTPVKLSAVSMGNPHCLIFQDDQPKPLDPAVYGPAMETHTVFPNKTNVEFIDVIDEHTTNVVVWERGCGFTLACGTGACAVAVAGIRLNKVKSPVTVKLPGGDLIIEWDLTQNNTGSLEQKDGSPVYMTGPATTVFTGTVSVNKQDVMDTCTV